MRSLHLVAAALVAAAVAAAPASAATVSGTIKGGQGLQVVVLQASGKGAKTTIAKASGAFSVAAPALNGASLQLVDDSGAYVGPILLGGKGGRVYATIKGRGSLALGAVRLRNGYATAVAPSGRIQTAAAYTVAARGGKPIGTGRIGRVKVGNGVSALKGYDGQGRDADLDGIPGAFDVDDNGNLILDNVDRTGRAGLTARRAHVRQAICPPPPQPLIPGCVTAPAGGGAVTPPTTTVASGFTMFSNFKLTAETSINLYLGGSTAAVQPLIDAAFPGTLTLATQVIGGGSASLDCLGAAYCAPHTTAGVAYPLVNGAAVGVTGTSIAISTGATGDAQITPGAAPDEIGSGNSFIQTAGGSSYPGILNFVFTTAPAVYSVTANGTETVLVYDPVTGRAAGNLGMSPATPITVGGDGAITLKWWRPQRQAIDGEASASGWIDIGGLQYTADAPNAPRSSAGATIGTPPGNCAIGSYSAPVSNGAPFTNAGTTGVLDPAVDTATDPAAPGAHLLQFTLNARTCFGETTWTSLASGATFDVDIQARSLYGDNAARKLYFRLA